MGSNTRELVMIPFPGMSHLVPTLQLAELILQTTQRISISLYIIYFPNHVPKVNAYLDSQSRDNPYPTRLTLVPILIQSNPPDLSPRSLTPEIELHKPVVKQAVEDRVKAGSSKPAGFVLQMFCAGLVDVANELDIPSYIFCSTGVDFMNIMLYAQSLVDDRGGVDIATDLNDPGFSGHIPGFMNPITSSVIPNALLFKDPWCDKLVDLARKFRETKGILVNSFVELESCGIQALMETEDKAKVTMLVVYPVGPIVNLENKIGGGYGGKEKDSTMKWLDEQPNSSVVFLCFGSMGCFDEEQVKEIANGLERAGYRFLWALRRPATKEKKEAESETFLEALPEGFLERTADKGKIIAFAPQVDILGHPAVGGFVSHCGWSSMLESVWFGVPVATWPMFAEQQLNAFVLVKELELGVEIRLDYKLDSKVKKGNFLITAEEIEKSVQNLMNMDEKMKGRVQKMSDDAKRASEERGWANKGLAHFIEDVLSSDH